MSSPSLGLMPALCRHRLGLGVGVDASGALPARVRVVGAGRLPLDLGAALVAVNELGGVGHPSANDGDVTRLDEPAIVAPDFTGTPQNLGVDKMAPVALDQGLDGGLVVPPQRPSVARVPPTRPRPPLTSARAPADWPADNPADDPRLARDTV